MRGGDINDVNTRETVKLNGISSHFQSVQGLKLRSRSQTRSCIERLHRTTCRY